MDAGNNQSYYLKRYADELAAAKRATCPQAAAAHRALADNYASMVNELKSNDDSPMISMSA
jgi:hypothetical protein